MKPIVIYHASCADGFTAAWVARRALDANCEFIAARYGDAPPDVKGRDVYVLDFSYPRAVLEAMNAAATSLVVLDHHKTAEEDLAGLPYCTFDMQRSGAGLAWDYFFAGRGRPDLVRCVEDGDLWRFAFTDTKAYRAYLGSFEFDFAVYDEIARTPLSVVLDEARAIMRLQARLVASAVRAACEVELAGHRVRCVNTTTQHSEVGHELGKGRPFSLTFFILKNGKVSYSLRSSEDGLDVASIARGFGGGGHAHAAGFVTDGFVHTRVEGT